MTSSRTVALRNHASFLSLFTIVVLATGLVVASAASAQATATTTVSLHGPHVGTSNPGFQEESDCGPNPTAPYAWHFVLNGLDSNTPAGQLTAIFQSAGLSTTGPSKVLSKTQHFFVYLSGPDTLTGASAVVDEQSGRPKLVLSHVPQGCTEEDTGGNGGGGTGGNGGGTGGNGGGTGGNGGGTGGNGGGGTGGNGGGGTGGNGGGGTGGNGGGTGGEVAAGGTAPDTEVLGTRVVRGVTSLPQTGSSSWRLLSLALMLLLAGKALSQAAKRLAMPVRIVDITERDTTELSIEDRVVEQTVFRINVYEQAKH